MGFLMGKVEVVLGELERQDMCGLNLEWVLVDEE